MAAMQQMGPVRLTPYPACSSSFFTRNGVFLSQHFSQNNVFQPISAKIQQAERGWSVFFFWRKRVLWCNLINWCPIQKWIGLQSVFIVCHSIMYHTRHRTKFDSKVNSNTWRDRWINLLATGGLSDHAISSRCNVRAYLLVILKH